MANRPRPARYSAKIRWTTRAVLRVGLELVQALAVGGLGRVGVRPGVGEPVAVGRAAAEEPALERGLGGHGGADPDLDPVPLAFGHAAEHRHDQVVGLGVRVDRAADLRDPQLDAVVGEDGHGQAVLVAVERPLRLADHHGVEAPARVGQIARAARWRWGRRFHGSDRDWPMSKYSATMIPPGGSIRARLRGLLPVVGRLAGPGCPRWRPGRGTRISWPGRLVPGRGPAGDAHLDSPPPGCRAACRAAQGSGWGGGGAAPALAGHEARACAFLILRSYYESWSDASPPMLRRVVRSSSRG